MTQVRNKSSLSPIDGIDVGKSRKVWVLFGVVSMGFAGGFEVCNKGKISGM